MKKKIYILLILLMFYGLGRVYYHVTDGFLIQNIHHAHDPDPKYEVGVSSESLQRVREILSVPFYYLGKGCQSYVFEDETKTYVVKFIKYQRYRINTALDYLNFIPWVESYTVKRAEHKLSKIDSLYRSWKTAFLLAAEETGVLFVHLNKQALFDKKLIVYDKMGLKSEIDLNEVEFLLQKRATPLPSYLEGLVKSNQMLQVEQLLQGMLERTMKEFQRGISDNDYALLQNTGVAEGQVVHIDVGQIIYNPIVKEPAIYRKELFNKTYKFRVWLRELSQEAGELFDAMLVEIIGPEFYTMPPYVNKANMGDLPNVGP